MLRDPGVVRGMLEDYRAGLTVDYRAEVADRVLGRLVQPPLLVLWSTRDDLEALYGDPLLIWRNWATKVTDTASTPGTTWLNWHQSSLLRRSHAFFV